ncbi:MULTISPECIES: transcriptional regulator [Pseudomonas syringae group]|uniref:transcriptional regulator n=1 Tax=Pseudomonas syringae group TaxID=136849 RepID=UPI0009B063FA|nr:MULTISPECIES: YdaS family helix-turn-helix protein [Pseudomonas syringae group]
MKATSPILRAVKAVGSQVSMAKLLGCTAQNVQKMCATGKVPGKHVLKIEAVSGVHRSELNPDLYPEASPTLNTNLRPISPVDQCDDAAGNSSSSQQAFS